ncbi:hypothetical protein ACEQ8H_001331 [Pleosporales sp. CAS-2024a]
MAPKPNFAFGGRALPAKYEFKGALETQLEEAEVREAQVQLKLEAALEQIRLLSATETDQVKALALKAMRDLQELRARAPWQPPVGTMADTSSIVDKLREKEEKLREKEEKLREKEEKLREKDDEILSLKRLREADTAAAERYQEQYQQSQAVVRQLEAELAHVREQLAAKERDFEEERQAHARELEQSHEQLEQFHRDREQLKREIGDLKADAEHHEAALSSAQQDQEHLRLAYEDAVQKRESTEVALHDLQLRFNSLHDQWQEDQDKIAELEGHNVDIAEFEARVKNFDEELKDYQSQNHERERIITVKDERIAHLESQLQKERTRNLNAADAAADAVVAAATSHTDAAPPSLGNIEDSLEAQLGTEYDSDAEFEHEVEFADASVQTLMMHQELAPVQHLSIGDTTSKSTEPQDMPPAPAFPFTFSKTQATSTEPTALPAPRLALSDYHTKSTEPTAVPAPVLALSTPRASSTTPTRPRLQMLTINNTATVATVPTTPSVSGTVANASVQTTETRVSVVEGSIIEEEEEEEEEEKEKPKTNLQQAMLALIGGLMVMVLWLWQYMRLYKQLQAWESANDYSYSSSSSSYNGGGAYGNGRYFFGIPLAMGVGPNWWTERFASIASRAITGYEKLAGIEYAPAY